jgi:hypothetical protein
MTFDKDMLSNLIAWARKPIQNPQQTPSNNAPARRYPERSSHQPQAGFPLDGQGIGEAPKNFLPDGSEFAGMRRDSQATISNLRRSASTGILPQF